MLSNDSSRLFEFQNKSFCLHNLSVCTVYIYYVYICKTYIKQIKYIFHLVKKVVSRFWTDKSGNNHTDRHLYKVTIVFCLIITLNLRWFAGFPPTSLQGAALTSRLHVHSFEIKLYCSAESFTFESTSLRKRCTIIQSDCGGRNVTAADDGRERVRERGREGGNSTALSFTFR